jgi:hypothetical protein
MRLGAWVGNDEMVCANVSRFTSRGPSRIHFLRRRLFAVCIRSARSYPNSGEPRSSAGLRSLCLFFPFSSSY